MRIAKRNIRSGISPPPSIRGRIAGLPALLATVSGGVVLAPRCGGCGDALPPERPATWCVHCRDRWGPSPGGWPAGVDGCAGWAAAAYRGPVRRSVLAAKRGAPGSAVDLLLRRWPAGQLPPETIVTWVPGHPLRTARAPDSGRALAEAIAARDGLQVRALLRRSPLGRRQAGRSDEARRASPRRLGLRALEVAAVPVLLVDDVRTTGTTLDHAGALLLAGGARSVFALTVAVAPSLLDS